MNVHEFQAKEILSRYGILVPKFGVARTIEDIDIVIKKLNLKKAVIKVQVHAGGRGKAGGIKFAKNPDEIRETAKNLLGMKLVNNQTGPEGVVAYQVMIAEPVDIDSEYYLGAVIDRENAEPIIIASPEGGMEIEEVAEKHPEKILKIPICLDGRVRAHHLVKLAIFMGWRNEAAKQGMQIAKGLAKAFIEKDASLLEINPLAMAPDGKIWAVDAKLSVDDNALYRQKEIASFYDPTQASPQEAEAKRYDLAYIALQGNIGCMVNGAGLAMATMDTIHHYGGMPANFLDVGGGATKEKVAAGFRIILEDPKVKAILVNIFGGIMNCATIAEGIISAASELDIKVPLIVRLEGTNVAKGKELLAGSKLPIISADDLAGAAKKAVEQVGG
ncbi:MAG: ADP-forming succinate--CoA ligase subunit beta [Simkaniaceae bacterium]